MTNTVPTWPGSPVDQHAPLPPAAGAPDRRTLTATASATIAPEGRLRHVASHPPLTLRKVFSEHPGVCQLCLVGSAAGPLPGDNLLLNLTVEGGAKAGLIATGASIAQGGGRLAGVPAHLCMQVNVGDEAALVADPGPLIVCAGSVVDVTVAIDLAASASLVWRETLVLGRVGETPGAASLNWDVTVAGAPLLRQRVDLTDPRLLRWPGLLAGARTMHSELRYDPNLVAETVVHSSTDVTQRIAQHASLRTTLVP